MTRTTDSFVLSLFLSSHPLLLLSNSSWTSFFLLSWNVYTSSRFSCHWMTLQFSYNHPVLQFIYLSVFIHCHLTEEILSWETFMGMQIYSWMSILSDSLSFFLLHSFSVFSWVSHAITCLFPAIYFSRYQFSCVFFLKSQDENHSRQWLKVLLFFSKKKRRFCSQTSIHFPCDVSRKFLVQNNLFHHKTKITKQEDRERSM